MLSYVTTNPGKVREAEEYLPDASVEQLAFDYTEIQAPELKPIAARGAREAHRHTAGDGGGRPVLVDDAGLFVDGLEGFPGPYSAYVEDTLGVERVWDLGRALENRRASFRCVLAYCDGGAFAASPDPIDREDRAVAAAGDEEGGALPVKLFEGVVRGRLVAPRGEGGFGYDPIFEHRGSTFAEMTPAEKNAVSHRGRALAEFGEWYAERN